MASNINETSNPNIQNVITDLKITHPVQIDQLKNFATLPLNIKNNYLFTAIGYNSVFAINWCIAHGADPKHIALGHTLLWHAVFHYRYNCPECAITLVKHGVVFNPEKPEHLLFQALDEYRAKFINTSESAKNSIKKFILDLFNFYPPELLTTLRTSTGETPFMVAKSYGITDPDILAEITEKTAPKNTNKNIYGRSLKNYKELQNRFKKPSAGGGRRKKTRRIARKASRKSRR